MCTKCGGKMDAPGGGGAGGAGPVLKAAEEGNAVAGKEKKKKKKKETLAVSEEGPQPALGVGAADVPRGKGGSGQGTGGAGLGGVGKGAEGGVGDGGASGETRGKGARTQAPPSVEEGRGGGGVQVILEGNMPVNYGGGGGRGATGSSTHMESREPQGPTPRAGGGDGSMSQIATRVDTVDISGVAVPGVGALQDPAKSVGKVRRMGGGGG